MTAQPVSRWGSPAPAGMVPRSTGHNPPLDRFPRTRGDGPARRWRDENPQAVPPHPRGWSPGQADCGSDRAGSSAPAGMVPSPIPCTLPSPWFPRTRGDGPTSWSPAAPPLEVPPHPRGWSPHARRPHRLRVGSPAPAGMVPSPVHTWLPFTRFPRTRGDGPQRRPMSPEMVAVPPHPRGWSPASRERWRWASGSPAPAGMVPRRRSPAPTPIGFPRTRGDGPLPDAAAPALPAVPPHPRGWSLLLGEDRRLAHGSPAPAGMVLGNAASWGFAIRFPRTRGDGPAMGSGTTGVAWVPPHPRGWSPLAGGVFANALGSPAPAGMVPPAAMVDGVRFRFPRTRGDGPDTEVGSILGMSVPPHPRGWPLWERGRATS